MRFAVDNASGRQLETRQEGLCQLLRVGYSEASVVSIGNGEGERGLVLSGTESVVNLETVVNPSIVRSRTEVLVVCLILDLGLF